MIGIETHKLYKGKVTLTFDAIKHQYKVDGEIVPGVTSILRVLAKPALIPWAANCAADYVKEKWEPGKSYDEVEIADILHQARYAHKRVAKRAAGIGTIVHDWCEKDTKGEKPKMPVNKEARKGIAAFLEWKVEHKVKFIHAERKIYHNKLGYAGTVDTIAKIDGKLAICDYKTSKAIYDEYFSQLAAYWHAYVHETGKKIKVGWIVRFDKETGGFEALDVTECYEESLRVFRGALEIDEVKRARKARKAARG